MSARHTLSHSARHDNRFMSDPDFVELRGINGTAVAAKAEYISEWKRRELLFFIQSLSIDQGGTWPLAKMILATYPERIGTPAMHKFGTKKGQIYSSDQVREVRRELDVEGDFPLKGDYPEPARYYYDDEKSYKAEISKREKEAQKHPVSYPVSAFLDICRRRLARQLPDFLIELCIDPKMQVVSTEETLRAALDCDRDYLIEKDGRLTEEDIIPATLICFRDIVGALFDYQEKYEASVRANVVMTSAVRKVWDALDYCLKTRKMILIEGDSGIGKSSGAEAWFDCHRGQARYARLRGINGRRVFFGTLAKPCGVGSTSGLSPEKIQAKVESFLNKSGLLYIIDEAQYMWPQGTRIRKHPELINWLDTACANEGVPVALVATDEFGKQRRNVEAQTTWNSFQLRRRIRRVFQIPPLPAGKDDRITSELKRDLEMLAGKLLPDGTTPMINYVVGYALASKGFFQAVVDCIDDARLIAKADGRERITSGDIKIAVKDWRASSDAALKRVFSAAATKSRRGKAPVGSDDCTQTAGSVQPSCRDGADNEEFHLEPLETNRVNGRELAGV